MCNIYKNIVEKLYINYNMHIKLSFFDSEKG
jgi:hypothetical protein